VTPSFHVAFPVSDGPTGGGNQFLRALRGELAARGLLADDGHTAGIVLFNSYQNVPEVVALRRANPAAVFVHRVDGPMRLYNRADDPRDALAIEANALIADATVFQTQWCRTANRSLGWPERGPERVIGNATDPAVFRPRGGRAPGSRARVIATSWSSNPNKGFDAYAWLDANLDAARYEMTFVGNSPARFANLRTTGPLDSAGLAGELAAHDLFVTASRKDPCSNSLIEALTVGLPAVARADGGHPELVGQGGLLFDDHTEIPALLDRAVAGYEGYRSAIRVATIGAIADAYVDFARELADRRAAGRLPPRRPGMLAAAIARWRFRGR
jgi:glycosyltransferase involved in cell wall biosynthesis